MAVNTRTSGAKRRKVQGRKKEEEAERVVVVEKAQQKKKEKKKVLSPLKFPLPLPEDLYIEVAKHVHESEALAFALTCRGFRDALKEVLMGKKRKTATKNTSKWLTTSRKHYVENEKAPVSRGWTKWAFSLKWEYAEGGSCKGAHNEEKKRAFLVFIAARCGFKDVLGWLRSRGCELGVNACHGAALGGQIQTLKYLKNEDGASFDRWTCWDAALGGHIKVLKYLKNEEGMSFDSRTCRRAALKGHLQTLKYLRSERVPLDSSCCRCAAYGGHLSTLKWLMTEGCPWNAQDCLDVAPNEEVREWIQLNM